jgi:hypothetical protein
MHSIRPEQWAKLEGHMRDELQRSITAFVREEFPVETANLSSTQLAALVTRLIATANSFGIDEPRPLAELVAFGVAIGEAIFKEPDVIAYLSSEGDQTAKVEALRSAIEELPER